MKIKQVIVTLLLFPSILWGQVVTDTAIKQNDAVADNVVVVQLPSLSTDYYSSLNLDRNYDYQIYNTYRVYTLLGNEQWLYLGSVILGSCLAGGIAYIGAQQGNWHWATIAGVAVGVFSICTIPAFIFGKKMQKKANQLRMESLELSLVHYELRNSSLPTTSRTGNSNSLSNFNLGISVSLHF